MAPGEGFGKVWREEYRKFEETFRLGEGRWKKNVRPRKDERVTCTRDGSFKATAASLSRRALNFPRLNRFTMRVAGDSGWCGVSSLYFLHAGRTLAKALVSSFAYIRRRNHEISPGPGRAAWVNVSEEIRFPSGWIAARCLASVRIYVSEIISPGSAKIKRSALAFLRDERNRRDFIGILGTWSLRISHSYVVPRIWCTRSTVMRSHLGGRTLARIKTAPLSCCLTRQWNEF